VLFSSKPKYSAFTDKFKRNCHFPTPDWNCITHYQVLQGFPDTSQVLLNKNNKINLYITAVLAKGREVTDAFNFISERTVEKYRRLN
jgi:hypothetical protein